MNPFFLKHSLVTEISDLPFAKGAFLGGLFLNKIRNSWDDRNNPSFSGLSWLDISEPVNSVTMKVLQQLWNQSSPRTNNCLAYSNYSYSGIGPPENVPQRSALLFLSPHRLTLLLYNYTSLPYEGSLPSHKHSLLTVVPPSSLQRPINRCTCMFPPEKGSPSPHPPIYC